MHGATFYSLNFTIFFTVFKILFYQRFEGKIIIFRKLLWMKILGIIVIRVNFNHFVDPIIDKERIGFFLLNEEFLFDIIIIILIERIIIFIGGIFFIGSSLLLVGLFLILV